MNQLVKGYLCVGLSAIIFGLSPVIAMAIYDCGGTPESLVFYRNALSLPALFILMVLHKGENPVVTRKELGKISLLSLMGAVLTPLLLFTSYHFISSGAATTIHFVYPAVVIIACAVFLRRPTSRTQWICVALCTAGVFFFHEPGGSGAQLGGMVIAFLSGVTYAFYIVYMQESGLCSMYPFKLGFYVSLICSLAMLVYALLTGSFVYRFPLRGWGLLLLFSLILTVGAVALFQIGVGWIGSQRAAILSTLEPITSIVVGLAFMGEHIGAPGLVGIVLILLAVLLLTRSDQKASLEKAAQPSTL